MRAVRWSDDAVADLEAQLDYIAYDNPAAARRVVARLRSAGQALGEIATGQKGRVPGTYEKVIPRLPYIIVYGIGIQPDGSEVIDILRVIHGARNWPPGGWPQ
jgi:addiction module RelE/StbE family toxin